MPTSPKEFLRHGSCLCKKVKVILLGEPQMKVLCHCESCQKSSGVIFEANLFYSNEVSLNIRVESESLEHANES